MKISAAEALRIARLANLDLDGEETALFARQMGEILSYIEQLKELDTSEVVFGAGAPGQRIPLRPDEPRTSLDPDRALSGAPASEARHFKVPQVI